MRNPTMSRDGVPRVDLKIAWRMDLRTLGEVLASVHDVEDVDDDLPAAQIRDEIRGALKSKGDDGWIYWTDEMDDDEVATIRVWAMQQVRRAFPELAVAEARAQAGKVG
jgi:hypothetical protein